MLDALCQALNVRYTAFLDWVFGFDLFISYTRKDNLGPYAIELARLLAEKGLICCVDAEEFETGYSWRNQGRRALKKSSKIVLLASQSVSSSKGIRDELEYNAGLKSPRPLSVINIRGALAKICEDSEFRLLLFKNQVDWEEQLWIPESSFESPLLKPCAEVVEKIGSDFKLRRQSTRRRISFGTALLALVLIVVALQHSFRIYDNKARAREILGKVGQTLPANAEDWEALETLARQGSALRESALAVALNEPQTSDRLTKRSKAFARAVVGLNARDRSLARSKILETLRKDAPEFPINGVFLISLAVDLELSDPEVTKTSLQVWKRAAKQHPDSSTLSDLGARMVQNLSTNDASDELWSLMGQHAQESLSTAIGPALTVLASRVPEIEREKLRVLLLGRLLEVDESSDEWRRSAKWWQQILSACSRPAPVPWARQLHKTMAEVSADRYRLHRRLMELLSDAIAYLEAKEADTIAVEFIEDFLSGKKYDPDILAKTLEKVQAGDTAIAILERTAHAWPIKGLSDDYGARQQLGGGLESLADQVPSNRVEQVASAIIIRLCDANRDFDGDAWEYQAMLGLRRPLTRLIPKLGSNERRWLLQVALSRPEADFSHTAGLWSGLAGVSPRNVRGALSPLLVDLIRHAPLECSQMLHNALISEKPPFGRIVGESIGRAASSWSPLRARDFLFTLATESAESISSNAAGALPGLVKRAGDDSPDVVLSAMMEALSLSQDNNVNLLCHLVDAIAIHPSLEPRDAEQIYQRLIQVRDSIPNTYSGYLIQASVSDRIERLEERLPPIRIQEILKDLPRSAWPSIGLTRALNKSDLERLWVLLPEKLESSLDGSSHVGDKVTYLGSRMEKFAAMADCLPHSQAATNLLNVVAFIQTHQLEGLARELQPVLQKLAERVPNEEAFPLSKRLLSHLRKAWTDECRAVIAEVVGTLMRGTQREEIILLLQSPVATDVVEREVLRHTVAKSIWQLAGAPPLDP